ncbi:E3 ubiquitin-protein ligase MYCBP2 [Orchesella cincta]|uniref:RCR-type E3 ubiquitin transferase n=1 Tax=Orchesella cincta TaxID=48709 RepID=A0A1D2NB44_ORCCI|nr:E3 ubiquitin-protein ligase MYCBP2 [Orchesella cincta]
MSTILYCSSKLLRLNGSPGQYQVVKCGVSGHNIRTRPCLRSPPVGILVMGSKFFAVDECYNNEGLWVKLDPTSQRKFCFTSEGEAWSLAVGAGEVTYLRRIDATKTKQGFDFSVASYIPQNIFRNLSPPAAFLGSVDAFSVSEPAIPERKLSTEKLSVSDVTAETARKEQVASAVTPTLRKSDEAVSAVGKLHNAPMHRSLPCSKTIAEAVKRDSDEETPKSPRSRSSSTFGALQKWLQMGAENRPSLPSASSISHLKQASSVVEVSKSIVKERIHAISGNERSKSVPSTVSSATQTSPEVNSAVPTSIQFNIGTSSWTLPPTQSLAQYTPTMTTTGTKSSPKPERKRKGGSVRSRPGNREKERGKSPQSLEELNIKLEAPAREAIGPGQAQSLRAVFGAVLWHAGIIHDAMACASYLRFNKQHSAKDQNMGDVKYPAADEGNSTVEGPLVDQGSLHETREADATAKEVSTDKVVMRKKSDSPAKGKHQRHSVEVTSAAWYLKGNPDLRLEPLGLKHDSLHGDLGGEQLDSTGSSMSTVLSTPKKKLEIDSPNATETSEIPPAVTVLEKIWAHVKRSCIDSIISDEAANAGSLEFRNSVKLRRDLRRYGKSQTSNAEHRKSRRDQPRHLHTMGRSFLLEPDEQLEFLDETNQCEICHVRFSCKGRSRKAHFGLSSLCENCSERQLKIKKQQQNSTKRPGFCTVTLDSGLQKYTAPDETHPYSVMLNNALFLLQMINTVPEAQLSQAYQQATGMVPTKLSFNCFTALGVTESQVLNEDDVLPDIRLSEIKLRRSGDGKLGKEKRSASTVSTAFEDSPWEAHFRRRKTSNGDQIIGLEETVGFTLLNHPSPVLQKILDAVHEEGTGIEEAIDRVCTSVLSFVTERHDLESLRLFLFQAIRRVTCRSYGMKILAWLMRSVSNPTALHDLLWWYAFSLEYKDEEDNFAGKASLDDGWWQMRAHPLNESPASIFPFLSESFYSLLQTIADIMPFLPIGSSLLEMAVKCWGVYFTRKDHRFLHKSKIFRNLSQIMSQFDGENERSKTSALLQPENVESQIDSAGTTTCLADFSHAVEIKVSSRAALSSSLTDESTETFWESGDEDRQVLNRTKSITIGSIADFTIKVVAVHVDNGRDSQYKVSSVAVKVGVHPDEYAKIGQVEIDSRHFGWVWFPIESEHVKVVKVELKGPDNTLRVRQMKVLGIPTEVGADQLLDRSSAATALVAQRKCENETLRIFRLLSSEVFGKFLYGVKRGDNDAEGNDLQEHVVGILFSRNKLTHLQKQVCSHIVSAIHREAIKIKEEFDSHINGSVLEATNENVRLILGEKPKIPDRYCFEMLTLVLALADHKLGRNYLSQQSNLIQDLMQLFHAGTPRIQRQVTSVVRKILPEILPSEFAKIICHQTHSANASKLNILDMFLGCVVKSLQVKVRSSQDGNRFARNININDVFASDELPSHYWFLRGEGEIQLANAVVKLIKDMCEESFSLEWSKVSKQAVADSVLYLTKIDSQNRNSTECLNSPQFWLALAALCVLHPEHSKLLSSPVFQNGSSGRAKCVNHDDGETLAVIQCHDCGDLCTECDRILHLPKKKWQHVRKVCKEEEESVRVDLHEGCGRIKLFWLMALADSSTLKALVEFRNGIPKAVSEPLSSVASVGRCRFCNKVGNSGPLALGNVCGETECQEYSKNACERVLECGHLCGGVRNENKCLPCLQGCSDKLGTVLKQDGDDMCMICFTDALAFAPAILLLCGHVFHYHCCRSVLEKRWPGPRITFSFSYCPICKVEIAHALLDDLLNPIRELFDDVKRKALMRLEYEGLNTAEGIVSPGGRYFQDPSGFAMDRYAYYVCFKCKKAYFGGEARCDAEIQMEFDPSELVCGGCSDISQAQLCPKHGTDYLEYKCRYCCSVAVFFCFGTTHFCNGCHDDFQRITAIPRNQLPRCPAGNIFA